MVLKHAAGPLKHTDSSSGVSTVGPTITPSVKRRRVPPSMTPNACTNCKKAKTQCGGGQPACKRCVDRKHPDPCRYEIQSKSAKSQLMQQIKELEIKGKRLEEEVDHARRKYDRMDKALSSLVHDHQRYDIGSQTTQDLPYTSIAPSFSEQNAVSGYDTAKSKLRNVDVNVEEEDSRTNAAPLPWLGLVVGEGWGFPGSRHEPSTTDFATKLATKYSSEPLNAHWSSSAIPSLVTGHHSTPS